MLEFVTTRTTNPSSDSDGDAMPKKGQKLHGAAKTAFLAKMEKGRRAAARNANPTPGAGIAKAEVGGVEIGEAAVASAGVVGGVLVGFQVADMIDDRLFDSVGENAHATLMGLAGVITVGAGIGLRKKAPKFPVLPLFFALSFPMFLRAFQAKGVLLPAGEAPALSMDEAAGSIIPTPNGFPGMNGSLLPGRLPTQQVGMNGSIIPGPLPGNRTRPMAGGFSGYGW